MTVEEAVAYAGRPLLVTNREVFFNTRDPEQADWWKAQGALVRPWYPDAYLASRPLEQGWEVDLFPACDKAWVQVDGDEVDVTRDMLVECALAR